MCVCVCVSDDQRKVESTSRWVYLLTFLSLDHRYKISKGHEFRFLHQPNTVHFYQNLGEKECDHDFEMCDRETEKSKSVSINFVWI